MTILIDIIDYDYDILIDMLAERKGRESVWYILRELGEKVKEVFEMVSKE